MILKLSKNQAISFCPKKKKIQYAVQESNIKIWVALCWFSLFRNLYTFRRYDIKIMTFITFIFPLSWQNVHTFITKEREITQYNRDTGQTFGVACIHMVARRLRVELAEVSDNIDICTDKISSNTRVFWWIHRKKSAKILYLVQSNTKKRKSLLYVIAQVWKVKVD